MGLDIEMDPHEYCEYCDCMVETNGSEVWEKFILVALWTVHLVMVLALAFLVFLELAS